jgi:hypothetical protein
LDVSAEKASAPDDAAAAAAAADDDEDEEEDKDDDAMDDDDDEVKVARAVEIAAVASFFDDRAVYCFASSAS